MASLNMYVLIGTTHQKVISEIKDFSGALSLHFTCKLFITAMTNSRWEQAVKSWGSLSLVLPVVLSYIKFVTE